MLPGAGQCRTPPAASPDRCDEYPQIQRPAGDCWQRKAEARPFRQFLFRRLARLRLQFSAADIALRQPLQRGAEADNPGDIRRTGLEAIGAGCGVKPSADLGDHFPPPSEGDIAASSSLLPYRAPSRSGHTAYGRKRRKIDIQRLHVRREMHRPGRHRPSPPSRRRGQGG